jgi:hypothetical protein
VHVRPEVHVRTDRDSAPAPKHAVWSNFDVIAQRDESATFVYRSSIQVRAMVDEYVGADRDAFAASYEDVGTKPNTTQAAELDLIVNQRSQGAP